MREMNINTKKLPLSFKDKAFWKTTISLGLPIAFQNMLSASFSLVDTLMVSNLGEVPLSATGMAGQWSWLLNMVLFGISSGSAVFISQYWGTKNLKGIRRTAGIAISTGLGISLLFLIAALVFPQTIISIFNQEPEVIKEGSKYLRIACLSYPATVINLLLSSTLRSTEHPKLPMTTSIISALANAILNYVLIFPAGLGVAGAAMATVISIWLNTILLLVISAARKNILVAPIGEYLSFKFIDVVEFFKKAAPVIANETMWGLGTVSYNVIFSNIGHQEYAAITIVRTFESFAMCFFWGLCNACCVVVGKSIGSGQIREGIRNTKRFLIIFPVLSALVGGVIILFRSPLVSIFNFGANISEYTIETAQWVLVIFAAWMIIRNIPYLLVVGILRPGGDTLTAMLTEIGALWFFSLPMTFLAANVWGLPFLAVYAVMYLCEDIPKAIIFLIYWRTGKWIRPVTEAGKQGLAEYINVDYTNIEYKNTK